MTQRSAAVLGICIALVALACDRNTAPFDPDEVPEAPDVSRIFPEGANPPAAPELPPAPAQQQRGAPSVAAEGGEPIRGTIQLAAELGDAVPPGAVLFVIARRGDAGPPLAVKRVLDPRFPMDFTLGPEDRMIQAMPFVGPLMVTARVDADGNATTRAPGDLQGAAAGPVDPGATGVQVTLDERL
jgi:cytochrome c-type biogenesis protein CcmH